VTGAASRRRGHDAERKVARYLRDQGWPDACTTRQKLGHDGATAPGDIDWHPLICLEVKDVKATAWPTWCRQAAAEAPVGTVPVVVRKTRGVGDVGAWECRVDTHPIHGWSDIPATTLPLDVGRTWMLPSLGRPQPGNSQFPGAWTRGDSWWQIVTMADLVTAVRSIDTPAPHDRTGAQ